MANNAVEHDTDSYDIVEIFELHRIDTKSNPLLLIFDKGYNILYEFENFRYNNRDRQ